MGHIGGPVKKQTSRALLPLNHQTGVVLKPASKFLERTGDSKQGATSSMSNMKTEALEEIVKMATLQMLLFLVFCLFVTVQSPS